MAALLVPLLLAGLLFTPWLLMLALGNFGLAQYGFLDVLPAGLLVAGLRASTSSSSS